MTKRRNRPIFHFYALFDEVNRQDVPVFAYACSKANGGAVGLEFTFFNKRRISSTKPQHMSRHELDADNAAGPPLHLPKRWYSSGEPSG